MSAMPERVLTPDTFNRLLGFYRSGRGGEYDAAADTLNAHDTALRAALLTAESRVREVEAASDDALEKLAYTKKDIDVLIEKCAALRAQQDALRIGATSIQMRQEAEIARLTAERDALVPLARYALNWCADDPAPSPEQRAAARALLARREKEGMGTHKPDCIGGYSCEADCGRAIIDRLEKEGA